MRFIEVKLWVRLLIEGINTCPLISDYYMNKNEIPSNLSVVAKATPVRRNLDKVTKLP